MPEAQIFIREGWAVHGLPASTITSYHQLMRGSVLIPTMLQIDHVVSENGSVREIPSLDHKIRHHAMELDTCPQC